MSPISDECVIKIHSDIEVLKTKMEDIEKKLGGWNRIIETLLIGFFLSVLTLTIKKIGG